MEQFNYLIELFNKGKINDIKQLLRLSPDTNEFDMFRGIIYMNETEYSKASSYYHKILNNNPNDTKILNNLLMLPTNYQNKKYIINLEGYLFNCHSFSIIMENIINNLLIREDIELHIDTKELNLKINDKLNNGFTKSINERIKPIDKTIMADLTIRITYPFDISPSPHSHKTLVFLVAEMKESVYLLNTTQHDNVYLMTPTEHSKKIINSVYPELNIDVIPHGIDNINWNLVDTTDFKNKYNINENDFVFLHLSSNTGNKNVGNIVSCFKELSKEKDNIKLILKFNSKLYNFETTTNFKNNNDDDNNIIIIIDKFNNDEMIQLYNSCNCYISPYTAEGFNMPALEAQSYGKMVIHTNNGPTDEFILYPNMFGIDSKINDNYSLEINNEDIYLVMEKAYNNKNNIKLKNEYILHTLNNYSWTNIVKKILNTYLF